MQRRDFIRQLAISGSATAFFGRCSSALNESSGAENSEVPTFLANYKELYLQDPRKACLNWFQDAQYGLFMHYGLYSILGRGEWVQFTEIIPVAVYDKLKHQFNPQNFDADRITDLALSAGMKYINLTSRHHDSFCLFDTQQSDFKSTNCTGRRDLVGELSEACQEKGLGLFLYYSYAADWKHPYFYPRELGWRAARPAYEQNEPTYLYQQPDDFRQYIDFCHAQIQELLTNYGPIAGIWLDPIMGYYQAPELFPIEETYSLIRSLQPHTLISFKQGANGDEDFTAPERIPRAHPNGGEVGDQAWEKNKHKPKEICDTLQPKDVPGNSWGYNQAADGKHLDAKAVMNMLESAKAVNANLLLNTGPLPDGSIDVADEQTLKAVGKMIS